MSPSNNNSSYFYHNIVLFSHFCVLPHMIKRKGDVLINWFVKTQCIYIEIAMCVCFVLFCFVLFCLFFFKALKYRIFQKKQSLFYNPNIQVWSQTKRTHIFFTYKKNRDQISEMCLLNANYVTRTLLVPILINDHYTKA